MNTKQKIELLKKEITKNKGILRLSPTWVPRAFLMPGGRLKLAPQDLYALGAERGGIDERWLASATRADNGSGTPEDEGLSYLVIRCGAQPRKILLKEAVQLMEDIFLGKSVMEKHGGWMVLTKLFDNLGPIPHHMHQMDEHAKNVGRIGKPEAYYFPPQLNFTGNNFPYTFFGLEPGTTEEGVKECLERWDQGDNGILDLSKAYRLKPGTGWDVPAGVLHAPGSLVTYEPQRASDVFAMFQSMVEGRYVSRELLTKDVPKEFHYDLDYLVEMLDWEKNVDPEFGKNRFRAPLPVKDLEEMRESGYEEHWVVYGTQYFSAKQLTIFPGRTVSIKDSGAYGLILMQGHGVIEDLEMDCPAMIRFGQLTNDEFFITFDRALEGVKITNKSSQDNIVVLKHFGPDNSEAPIINIAEGDMTL